jgi:hypothetical protein
MFTCFVSLTIDLTPFTYTRIVYSCSLYVLTMSGLITGHGASGLEGEWLFKASLVDLTTKIVIVRLPHWTCPMLSLR